MARDAFSRAGDRFREHEIRAGRDLQIRRLAFDNADDVTGPLGERRFIGGVNRLREGIAEDIAPERLRRLRQVDRLARDRLADVVSGFSRPSTMFRAALRLSKGRTL